MTYTLPANITEIRKRAWETRRARYGKHGHAGSYLRGNSSVNAKMLAVLVRLHVEGVISGGQMASATDLHRIEIRRLSDEYVMTRPEMRL